VLNFFYCDGILFANFDATLATEAFILIHGFGLAVNQFVDVHGAYIDTFAITDALVFIYCNLVTHSGSSVVSLVKSFLANDKIGNSESYSLNPTSPVYLTPGYMIVKPNSL
jgi:hypothetical protein